MGYFSDTADKVLQKEKYFKKILSSEGFLDTWDRFFQMHNFNVREFYLQVLPFDLTQLGVGLMFLMNPIELEPLTLLNEMSFPSIDELLQGIWINFEAFNFSIEFPEFYFNFDFIFFNFNFDFIFNFMHSCKLIAKFGTGVFGLSVFDPYLMTEYLRSGIYKSRLQHTVDSTFFNKNELLQELSNAPRQSDDILNSRYLILRSAQTSSFTLGLSPLGSARFSKKENGLAKIPAEDANGNPVEITFTNLEELMFGLYLGIIPLGYGCTIPPGLVFAFEDGKKMPKFFKYLDKKMKTILRQTIFTPWAYRNYHKPEEDLSPHKSARTCQYHSLQTQRLAIERIVESNIPPEERNPVRIRQYQNAVLQLISHPAKRHFWGFKMYELMGDDFKTFWLDYWQRQGLNKSTLEHLYEVIKPCLNQLRREKLYTGSLVRKERRNLAKMMLPPR
uniref:Uncharacterized protein n=1 Tax=Ignisphaera aggregans TaxID=334771 RepID=A0A7J3JQ13_9CREN